MHNRAVTLLSLCFLFTSLGCSAEKKKEEVIAREVTFVALAGPSIASKPIGAEEIEPFDLLGDVYTQYTLMTGSADKYGGRLAAAGVVIGPIIGEKGTDDHTEDLQTVMDIPAFPILYVPGVKDSVSALLKERAGAFGRDDDGKAQIVKASEKSGKKFFRMIALDGGALPEGLDKLDKEVWLVGVLNRPVKESESFPKRCNLILAPTPDENATVVNRGVPVIQLPSLQRPPFRFFTLTLYGSRVELMAWPAQLNEEGAAPKELSKQSIDLTPKK